jgi:hypothetical protein
VTAVAGRGAPTASTSEKRAVPRVAPPSGARRAWPWALVAIALGAAGAVAPLPALIVLSGAGVVLLAIAAPRTMVGLTALVVLFVRPLEHLVLVAELGYLDEALIAVCAVTLPLRRWPPANRCGPSPASGGSRASRRPVCSVGSSWTSRPASTSLAPSSCARA